MHNEVKEFFDMTPESAITADSGSSINLDDVAAELLPFINETKRGKSIVMKFFKTTDNRNDQGDPSQDELPVCYPGGP